MEGGYGAGGVLGLANPAWQLGLGTGFGRRSPVALLVGVTGAESTDYGRRGDDHYFLQVEAGPTSHRWQVSSFFTFGAGTYSRVAAQMAYRLPLRTAPN